MAAHDVIMGAAGAVSAPVTGAYIEEVFATNLYTGTGTPQTIKNGINIGSNGGGSALFDNSTNCYVSVPAAATSVLDLNSVNWTVECFAYFNAWNSLNNLFGTESVNNYFGPRSSGTNFEYQPGSGAQFNFSCTLALNTWYHIALTKSGTSVRCFVNGVQVGTTVTSSEAPFLVSSSPMRIGAYANGGNNSHAYISNFRVVKGTALYTANFTTPTSALTAVPGTSLLTLQGATPFVDNSGNNLTITKVGTAASDTFGPFNDGSGKGGLVIIKGRSIASEPMWHDTARGAGNRLRSDSNVVQAYSITDYLSAFNGNGFSIGIDGAVNTNTYTYAAWTFRKQAKFFDVVTYTGNGATGARAIPHSLGSVPGCIIVKYYSGTAPGGSDWYVYHRGLSSPATQFLRLSGTGTQATTTIWGSTSPTASEFYVATTTLNQNGTNYVAYIFAHDAGGFGPLGTDNAITCGSYVGNSSVVGPTVNLGYEPQWLLIKNITTAGADWLVFDNMRAMSTTASNYLRPNTATTEIASSAWVTPTATGFYPSISVSTINATSNTYIFIAVRRGPMKVPINGTSVLSQSTYTGNGVANRLIGTTIVPDLSIVKSRDNPTAPFWNDRVRGAFNLLSSGTSAEQDPATQLSNGGIVIDNNSTTNIKIISGTTNSNDVNQSGKSYINWNLIRSPSVFDVVAYTGTGALRTVSHGLTVPPELMIVRRRDAGEDWNVFVPSLGSTSYLRLSTTAAVGTVGGDALWGSTLPTSTNFTVKTSGGTNATGGSYVAYLFASCSGVSKVGTYVGTASTAVQNIDCGFAAGARFVLIKRTDGAGGWYVWDSARGISASSEVSLLLNSDVIEATSDMIDPYFKGFAIDPNLATDDIWRNGSTYIYLAIA